MMVNRTKKWLSKLLAYNLGIGTLVPKGTSTPSEIVEWPWKLASVQSVVPKLEGRTIRYLKATNKSDLVNRLKSSTLMNSTSNIRDNFNEVPW